MRDPLTIPRRNLVVHVSGPIGSGKSRLLHTLFTARSPRTLTIDAVGDARRLDPHVIEERGMTGLRSALRFAVPRRRWHIAVSLDAAELLELAALLRAPRASTEWTWLLAAGGVTLVSHEAQDHFPTRGCPGELQTLVSQSRHALLSLHTAGQRMAMCHRLLTSQAHVIAVAAQHEPDDLRRCAELWSRPIAEIVRGLPEHHFLYWDRRAPGRFFLVSDPRGRYQYQVYRVLGLDGTTGA